MTEATLTWSIWQALLAAFAYSFTRRGFRRFAEWITAMALNVEEHTITQSVLALEQPAAWKALENFAEYGGWHEGRVTYDLTRLVQTAPGRAWHGYHVSAVDDTKVHRTSPHVWGTCTFHEYTARCPNRASTVRAHNWVVLGAVLHEPKKPGWFLPITGRLYFRKSQLPAGPDGIVAFRTKCELAIDLFREQARIAPGHKHLGVVDGGFALRSVVRPLVLPEDGARPDRRPDPAAARRPALRPAARRAPRGESGAQAQVGPTAGAAVPGRPVEGGVANRQRLRLRPRADDSLEGDRVPVGGAGMGGPGQGDRRGGPGVQEAVHPGDLGRGADRAADGGVVRGAVPARGRVPRPEAAAGLGGVPGVDQEPDRADQPGAVGDDELAAPPSIPAGGGRGGGLVVPTAVAQGQGPSQRAGRGAADAAASGGNSAASVGVAGR